MAKCIVCHERKAEVPDRYAMSNRARVCRECHRERLRKDMAHVLSAFQEANEKAARCTQPRCSQTPRSHRREVMSEMSDPTEAFALAAAAREEHPKMIDRAVYELDSLLRSAADGGENSMADFASGEVIREFLHEQERRIAAQDDQINALQQKVHLCAGYDRLEALLPLAKYGRGILDLHRDYFGDVDGGDAQDMAEALGLLAGVEVSEPCGEECNCASYGDFPQKCLRETKAAQAMDEWRAAIGESDEPIR